MKLGLAGDTMLGRSVAQRLATDPPSSLFSDDVVEIAHEADLFVLNLECCISSRGRPWEAPDKPFFFRAPPRAVEVLSLLGVDCVTLANNHALDFGHEALVDTLDHLRAAAIPCAGAGTDLARARAPVVLERAGLRVGVVSFTDHPEDFGAGPSSGGVALAPLDDGVPEWVLASVRRMEAEIVLVSPHWGPNMTAEPPPTVRRAARELIGAGATLVAGHSAHVFHGVQGRVLYDLGDFIDDYATDAVLRNDLGLLFLIAFDGVEPVELEAVPLKLDFCHTRIARGGDRRWIEDRWARACAALGTAVDRRGERLAVDLRDAKT
jgi:poly-gamma-glutamate capsule biosynthesis protein CapA/YwtB (metallophosphatase superfamily)